MLDGIAIGWGIAAAFALAIACCGPNPHSKLVSAYLFGAWTLSNQIFETHSTADSLERFAYMDTLAASVLIIVWFRWPSRWLGVLWAALFTQIVFQTHYTIQAPQDRNEWAAILVNNLLYGIQLIAVVSPTFTRPKRRDSVRARRRPPKRPTGKPDLKLVA